MAAILARASCATATAAAQLADAISRGEARTDAIIGDLMAKADVPGLVIAVVRDGSDVTTKAFGFADVASKRPLTPDTIMYAASLTKPAFVYMTLQLVDEGLIDLDAPLPKQLKHPLPTYPGYSSLGGDTRWRAITPRMLLSHSSGLPNWRWVNDDRKLDIKYKPGTRYVYSGEGMQLMQLIDEERSGKTLQELMKKRVFDRFGMSHTSMVWRDDFFGSESNGYDANGTLVPHAHVDKAQAAASMDTTVGDYARFVAGVLHGEGLAAKQWQEMLRPQLRIVSPQEFPSHFPGITRANDAIRLSAGLGWVLYQSPLGPAMFKEGNDDGTNNLVLAFPRSKSAVVILVNSARGDRIFFPLVESLYGHTCLPWFWMGYIPYDRPDLRNPGARAHPIDTCSGKDRSPDGSVSDTR
ncbi:MAG: serine hydrolase domain-containing protein [Dokdonella sp.]